MSTALKFAPVADDRIELYRFSVGQYHRLYDLGILKAGDRVELLEGRIVEKMPRKPPHNGSIGRINKRLVPILPDDWLLRVQSAITLTDSEPEPDFAIVKGPEEIYFKRHPRPADIAVLMEVAESTLMNDRRRKAALYANARIPEYWIINLVEKAVEVFTSPRTGRAAGYRKQRIYMPEESVPLVLRGKLISHLPVKGLLGP